MIKDRVLYYKQQLVKLTKNLVSIYSPIFLEKEIIDFLAKTMTDFGFEEVSIDDFGNLIGRIGNGRNIIAIDGHVDTVEIGSREDWPFDPLKGKEDDKIIYGRGSCDQKGGVASALIAALILKEIGLPKNTTLYVVCSVLEEFFEGLNWQHIIEKQNIKPNVVILTEPSDLAISLGHRGRCDIEVSVKGISSHGSEPDKGENAIYKMNEIIAEIQELHNQLPIDPIFGKGTLAVTKVSSEAVSINAVPDKCTIFIDRRLGQSDSLESALEQIKNLQTIKKYNANVKVVKSFGKSYTDFEYTVDCFYPTWTIDENHNIVKIAKEVYEKQFSQKPITKYWRFSTNGVATKGKHNIPTIGFGPGEEKFAHTSNEQVPIEHLLKSVEFLVAFCLEWAKS
ncbi:MAG: YgeY family selenium metabolism-linked hydrolase [Asgard group archaeon]|nr:YgeY family selenium metabolism-linked hydrolase [Asgard group archaeon]